MITSPDSTAAEPPHSEGHPGVAGNERLTALAGVVLLALIVVEVATIASVRAMMIAHIFVGVTLVGPLAVKSASTGWRFLRYYTRNPAYRRQGPPVPVMRVLSPLLLIVTFIVVGSGIALVATSPGEEGLLHAVHHASSLVWVVLVSVHVLVYIRRVPRLIASDWWQYRVQQAPGRGQRLALNLAALIVGAIAATLVLPAFFAWTHW